MLIFCTNANISYKIYLYHKESFVFENYFVFEH